MAATENLHRLSSYQSLYRTLPSRGVESRMTSLAGAEERLSTVPAPQWRSELPKNSNSFCIEYSLWFGLRGKCRFSSLNAHISGDYGLTPIETEARRQLIRRTSGFNSQACGSGRRAHTGLPAQYLHNTTLSIYRQSPSLTLTNKRALVHGQF